MSLITEFKEHIGGTQTAFSKRHNIYQPHLSDVLNGRRKSTRIIELLLKEGMPEEAISSQFVYVKELNKWFLRKDKQNAKL